MNTPARWVRPNHGSRFPRRWIYVTPIVTVHRTMSGMVERWAGAVAAHRGHGHRRDSTRGLTWSTFTERADLWVWIDKRTEPRARTIVVTHDASTFLRVADALPTMVRLGWECTGIRLDDGSTYVQWRRGDRTLLVIDLRAWVAEPMATITRLIDGYDRGDRLPPRGLRGQTKLAAVNVSTIATAWEHLMAWCEQEDLGNWHPTGAGQAWAAWRHRFMGHKVLHHGLTDVAADERASVYCGRTEALRWGKMPAGRWVELDYQRAYVAVCRAAWLPSKLMWSTDRPNLDRILRAPRTYRHLMDVTVTTALPSVPYRDDVGICWPVGTFRSWLWADEARAVIDDGGHLEVHRAHVYRGAQVLADWAAWCDDVLDGRVASAGPLEQRAVKHWGRALVGRFGAQWSEWAEWGAPLDDTVGITKLVDRASGTSGRLLAAGGPLLLEGPKTDGKDTAIALMSAVMSATRIKLHTALRAAPGSHVAHCDTDGLIVQQRSAQRVLRACPGLRVKAEWDDLTVLGPRQLTGDRGVRISGIPTGATRPDTNGTIRGQIRQGYGAALGAGTADSITVTRRTWNVQGHDTRRTHTPHGNTLPVVIDKGTRQ